MGRFYKYCCEKCGFEEVYRTGCGFFTEELLNKTIELEQEFHSELISGKYGQLLKELILADENKELRIDCSTDLFQCNKCYSLIVCHGKQIFNLKYQKKLEYDLSVEMDIDCPKCSGGELKRVVNFFARCPKCKEEILKLESFGFWD